MAVSDYSDLFEAAGRKHNVDPALLAAISYQETRGREGLTSPQGAVGLMQFMPRTAKGLGIDPLDPAQAVDGAARLISESLDRNNGDVGAAVGEYHGGPSRKIWGPKTRKYQSEVLARYQGGGADTMAGGPAGDTFSDDDLLKLASGEAPKPKAPQEAAGSPQGGLSDEALLGLASGEKGPPKGSGKAVFTDTGEPGTAAQEKFYLDYNKSGKFDPNAAPGSEANPMGSRGPDDIPDKPGAYYVTPEGKLVRVSVAGDLRLEAQEAAKAGNMPKARDLERQWVNEAQGAFANRLVSGVLLGGKNELVAGVQTLPDILTGKGTEGFKGRLALLDANDAAQHQKYPIASDAGAVTGTVASSVLLPEAKVVGTAGKIGVRALEGAAMGGTQGFLGTDGTLEDRAKGAQTGAEFGGLLGAALPAAGAAGRKVGKTVRDFVQPLSENGRAAIANRIVGKFGEEAPINPDASEIIPGSVPTLAQATANPGIATLERTVRLSRPAPFAERAAQNAEARSAVLDAERGDVNTVADLAANRRSTLDRVREQVFDGARPSDGRAVAQALDEALASPEAHMEEVSGPLQKLREKVVQPAAETTSDQISAFNREVSRTFGADAARLTPEVMSDARSALGARFEEIAGKTRVPWDDALRTNIGRIIKDTADVVPESQLPPLFKQLDNIASTAKEGEEISGASYQALTKKGSPLDSLMGSGDPTIRQAASRIREALDDALERTLGAEGTGSALAELRQTRLAYKNLKTVESALKSAGADKQVTAQAVMSAVKRNFGDYAYKGGGALGDVAERAVREQASRPEQVVTDPRQLFGMRESISGAIDKLEKRGTDAGDLAAARLRTARESLDAEIARGAPGYAEYLQAVERSNEPVEATKFLQSLRLTDAGGKITLSRIDSALKRIADMRARAGSNPAKSISDQTLSQLEAIRSDLRRESNSSLGRPMGSDTAQHLATGNIANGLSVPLALGAGLLAHNPVVGAAVGAGKLFYGMKNEQILDALANRLLNPEGMKNVTPRNSSGVARRAARALPAGGAALGNRIVGPAGAQ